MGDWFRYRLKSAVDPELLRDVLDDVPGAKLTGKDAILAGENCAWLLERRLAEESIAFDCSLYKKLNPTVQETDGRKLVEELERKGLVKQGIAEWIFGHQAEAISYFVRRDSGLALHPCGSGKTATSILASMYHPGLTVVTTIASVRRQFGRAVDQMGGHARVIAPGPKARNDYDSIANDVKNGITHIVVGWESLPQHLETLLKLKPKKLILDEIHRGKQKKRYDAAIGFDGKMQFSKKANISSAAMDLSRIASWRLGLTATFIPNRTEDAWAQLDLLEPGQWGSFLRYPKEGENRRFSGWAARYCSAKAGQWGGVDTKGESHLDELMQRMCFLAHIVDKAEAMKNVPPARREVVYLAQDEQVKTAGFEREIKEAMQKGGTFLAEILLAEAAARKRSWIMDRIESPLEDGQKVVVLTGRHKDCERLANECHKRFKNVNGLQIFTAPGSLSPTARDRIKSDYVESVGPTLLVGTRDAWSTGVDGLQCTDVVVNAMLPWTIDKVTQTEGRFTRLGSTKNVILVYPICENTYDEKIADVLLKKLPAVAALNGDDMVSQFGKDLKGADQGLMDSLFDKILESVPKKNSVYAEDE